MIRSLIILMILRRNVMIMHTAHAIKINIIPMKMSGRIMKIQELMLMTTITHMKVMKMKTLVKMNRRKI